MSLAYPGWPINLGFLAWIGLVTLFWALSDNSSPGYDRVEMRKKWITSNFAIGFAAGLVYFLIVLRWFWSFYPLDTLGINSRLLSLLIIFIVWLISAVGMAVFWGLFGLLTACSLRLTAGRSNIANTPRLPTKIYSLFATVYSQLLVPAIFVLLEYARSYGFGILWFGSGSLFGPHWTLGSPAYSLANSALALKLTSAIGIYAVVYLIILVNFLFYKLTLSKKFKKLAVLAVLVFLFDFLPSSWVNTSTSPNNTRSIRYALIQTNSPTKLASTAKEELDGFKQQLNLLNQAAKDHPDTQLIVFPEGSDFFKNISNFLTGGQIKTYFTKLFATPRLIIAGGRIIDTDQRAYSRTFTLNTQHDIVGYYDKRLLTPGGEYLPYPVRLIANLISPNRIGQFGAIRELQVGHEKTSTVKLGGQFSAAPIICSELTSPDLSQLTTKGADVIAGMASYGIFHGRLTFIRQNLATARFRAVENNKPVILAANMGRSYVINSRGLIDKIAPTGNAQILTGKVAIGGGKSWYNKVSDYPLILGSLVLVMIGFIIKNKHE